MKKIDYTGFYFLVILLLAGMLVSIAFTPVTHKYNGTRIWQADTSTKYEVHLFNNDTLYITGDTTKITLNGSFLKPESPIRIQKDGKYIPAFCKSTDSYFDTECHLEESDVGTTYTVTVPPGTYLKVEVLGGPNVDITFDVNRTSWFWLNSPAVLFSIFF